MMSLWFDLSLTLKTLNLSRLWFFEWSEFHNYVCKWQCHKQSLPTWCHKYYLIPQDIVFAWIYVIGITNRRANYGERSQLFFSLFLMKKVYGKMFFFSSKFGRLWLGRIIESLNCLVVDDKWVMNVFRVWQVVSLSVCVCVCLFVCFVFFNYFTLCYWNSCYIVGIAYIHQL